jgi:hypothetical protein
MGNPGRRFLNFLLLSGTFLLLLILAGAGVYARYIYPPLCEADSVRAASSLLSIQLERYDHAYQFATSASADSLVHPVSTLQQIMMDTQEIDVPVCMQRTQKELVGYMVSVLRAFQAYGASETEENIRNLLDRSDKHYANFQKELEAVNECAPFCFP